MKNAVDIIITAYIASAAYVAAIGSLNIMSSIAARITHWPMTMTFYPRALCSADRIRIGDSEPDIGYEYHCQEHSCHKHSPFPGKLI